MRSADTHLEAAAAYIAVAESADSKRVAYQKAADEILAALAADPSLSQREAARRIGKGHTWLVDLLAWRRGRISDHGADTPFATEAKRISNQRARERTIPTRHEDRVEMAAKLLEDREVVDEAVRKVLETPSPASRRIERIVADRESARRKRATEQARRKAEREALPLPALMFSMIEKMGAWATELDALIDDLDTLPDGPDLDVVVRVTLRLRDAADRWLERLDRSEAEVIELDQYTPIEGKVVS